MKSLMNSELEMFEQTVQDFAEKELAEGRQENDRPFAYPQFEGVLRKANVVGFFSVTLPEELGGCDMGITELCVMLENISRIDASLAAVIFTDTLAKEIVYRARGFVLLKELLTVVSEFNSALFAFPSQGDPAERGELSAAPVGEGLFTLDGKADYVVLGGLARHAVLPAETSAGGHSFFLVDLSGPGVSVGDPVASLGLHACPAVDITLEGARGRLVGDEGEGAVYLERVAGRMNAAAAAMSLGLMKGSFEEAVAYARERQQGGREIVNWSEVRRILARMAVKVKVADMVVSEACRTAQENLADWELGAMAAALFAGEMSVDLTTDGIQVLGGNGYMEDYGQEKRFRDAAQVRSLLGNAPLRELRLMGKVLGGASLY
ncbi:MAG: acyl-CoA dehydrogenase family protein [Candidatus Geothermincolia bacterium]